MIPDDVLDAIVPDVDGDKTLRDHLQFFDAHSFLDARWQMEKSEYTGKMELKEFIAWTDDFIFIQTLGVFGDTILRIPKNPPA